MFLLVESAVVMNRKNSCVICSQENPSATITSFHFESCGRTTLQHIEVKKGSFHQEVSAVYGT